MYLDTDIILAVIKREDWLKRYVDVKLIPDPKTSVLTVVEAELVLMRELGRQEALSCLDDIKENGILLLPMSQKIVEISCNLLKRYPRLNIFDSIHAAFALTLKEEILSTDSIFDRIPEIKKRDPRSI